MAPEHMIIQCAWCLQIKGADGIYSGEPVAMNRDASHGICPTCYQRVRLDIDAMHSPVVYPKETNEVPQPIQEAVGA